jgi:hypothetical protein
MKYGESTAAQRRANADGLLHLRDIADQPISITGYDRRQSRYDEGTYLILSVVLLTEPQQRTVKVITSASVVMDQVMTFFEDHPSETLEGVITKCEAADDRSYWKIVDPDEYENRRAARGALRTARVASNAGRRAGRTTTDDERDALPF